MKVSAIVAAYNIENYIERCLVSITNQTLKDIEIIVVNDGSKDSTLEKIEKIARDDKRIVIVDQVNKGLIEARKSGLKKANGEYVLFIDGDDWIETTTLEVLYNNATKNNSDIVIYNAYLSYDDRKEKFDVIFDKNLNKDDYVQNLFLGKVSPCIWSKFIKLDFIKKNEIEFPSDISFAEDLATVSNLFIYNPKVSVVDEFLYHYYQREDSLTNTVNKRVLELDEAVEFIKQKLIEKGLYEKYKIEFDYMVYSHLFKAWFIPYRSEDGINKNLYEQFKARDININKNKLIKDKIKTYPLNLKMRVKVYNKDFELGRKYDTTIKRIKGDK